MAENVQKKQIPKSVQKESDFGVLEMDQNRVKNRKLSRLCRVFVLVITWPIDL